MSDNVFYLLVIGLPVLALCLEDTIKNYLKHQRYLAELKTNNGGGASREQIEKLETRIAALETHCAKLQDQVNLAHDQLADERRVLDSKLNAMLPDLSSPPAREPAKTPERQKTIN